MLGDGATKAGIESALQSFCKRLKPSDSLWFFYSGHGFHRQGKSVLICRDSRSEDLPGTGFRLAFLVETLRKTGCPNLRFFLDPSHDPGTAKNPPQGFGAGLAEVELKALFTSSSGAGIRNSGGGTTNSGTGFADIEIGPAFIACGQDEKSFASARLKHGIWSHHLIRVLEGSEKDALEKGHILTAQSLQAHLEIAVPKSVRNLMTGTALQTPRVFGNLAKPIVLLDFKRIFEARSTAEAVELKSLEQAFFRGANSDSVKRLSGWKKGFRLPDTASLASTSFIQSVGSEDLKARFDSFHERIRKNLNYKRSAVTTEASPGTFTCITPDFTFSISLGLDPGSPTRYVESLVLSEIRNPSIVASPGFGAVFDSEFDEVVLEYSRPFDIGKIIDAIEGMNNPKVGVEYPPDANECTVVFASLNIRLRFSGQTLVYAFAGKALVRKIMDAIRNAPRVLGLDRLQS